MDVNAQRGAPDAAEMAAGMAGLEVAGVAVGAQAPAAAPAVAAAVRWLTEKKREAIYELLWPFALDGVEYRTIIARRMTGGQVATLLQRMRGEPEKEHRWPMFYVGGDSGDAPLPDAVWDALDDDDRLALTEIAEGFLPNRFRSPSPAPTEPEKS